MLCIGQSMGPHQPSIWIGLSDAHNEPKIVKFVYT